MTLMQDLQHAIQQLPAAERATLATWILESQHPGGAVAESAPAYNTESDAQRMSAEQYLLVEETAPIRHEFVGGEMFAMTGVSLAHNLIAMNVASAFRRHLQGGPCKTFVSDVKVRLRSRSDDIFYYPDVIVACGARDLTARYLTDPKVIVEVLSPSTEAIDRREKLLNYRGIRTLDDYVLIAQTTPEVTLHRRGDRWKPLVLTEPGAVVELASLGLSLPVEDIYSGAL